MLDEELGFALSAELPSILRTLRRFRIPPEHWEDLLQSCLVAWIMRRSQIRNHPAWLQTVVQRQAIRFAFRSREGTQLSLAAQPEAGDATGSEALPLRLGAREALSRLRPTARRALWLRFVEGRSVPEVAAALGTSACNAKKVLTRGLARLRRTFFA